MRCAGEDGSHELLRAVTRSDVTRSDEGAVGATPTNRPRSPRCNPTTSFPRPQARHAACSTIGCGTGGREVFIEHLDAGDDDGIDISPDILLAVQRTLAEAHLQHNRRTSTWSSDLKSWSSSRPGSFDVVDAQSVLSALPDRGHRRVPGARRPDRMKPAASSTRPSNRTEGRGDHVLREDFYDRTEALRAGRAARPDRTAHERLGRSSRTAIQAAHLLRPGQTRLPPPVTCH